MMDKRSNF